VSDLHYLIIVELDELELEELWGLVPPSAVELSPVPVNPILYNALRKVPKSGWPTTVVVLERLR